MSDQSSVTSDRFEIPKQVRNDIFFPVMLNSF